MFYIWIIIIGFLTIVEFVSVNLISVWFVISAIAAMCVSLITDNFLIQFAIFVIMGVLMLITTRPIMKKVIKVKEEKTNIDRIIGMSGIVTKKIIKNNTGEVKVDGKYWTAYSDETIESEALAKILKITGSKIKVKEEK